MRAMLPMLLAGSMVLRAYPVAYSVNGTFGNIQNGGPDLLHLSGQAFRITGTIDSKSLPAHSPCGGNCIYERQELRLAIPSLHLDWALTGVPVTLVAGSPGTLAIETRVLWVPFAAVVKADLGSAAPQAFASERIEKAGSTVTYGRGRNRTILGIEGGTVSATAIAPSLGFAQFAAPGTIAGMDVKACPLYRIAKPVKPVEDVTLTTPLVPASCGKAELSTDS